MQDATQDDKAEDDRYLDDKTSDIDILDAHNYGIEKWYKTILRIKEEEINERICTKYLGTLGYNNIPTSYNTYTWEEWLK